MIRGHVINRRVNPLLIATNQFVISGNISLLGTLNQNKILGRLVYRGIIAR